MITMIIVEDEGFERKSLINYIDWNLIGVEVVGEASNGEQGLTLTKQQNPDMILTDINMPVMDAIEMSTRIRQFNQEVKIIFLSSYDDFEYAKQAIELHIFSYIMKPINEGELLKCVKKAVDSITEERLEFKINSNYKNAYHKDMSLIKEALLLRILMGVHIEREEVEKSKLSWLINRGNTVLCMFLILYEINHDMNHTEMVSNILKGISQNSTCVCFNKKSMIAILSIRKDRFEENIALTEKELMAYFRENQFGQTKLIKEFIQDESKTISQVYESIFQNNASTMHIEINAGKSKKMKSKQEIVNEIEEIILRCYMQPLTIEGIAQKLHFTPNYIGMVYKNCKHESINHFLMNVRIKEAKKLLEETELAINEISYQCGFDNVTYFHTLFKKTQGITPNEYRKRNEV